MLVEDTLLRTRVVSLSHTLSLACTSSSRLVDFASPFRRSVSDGERGASGWASAGGTLLEARARRGSASAPAPAPLAPVVQVVPRRAHQVARVGEMGRVCTRVGAAEGAPRGSPRAGAVAAAEVGHGRPGRRAETLRSKGGLPRCIGGLFMRW